ncbi:MAG: heparinase II/III family protein [Clostridia bacterium]|nr:heparinase II/III family protein [Clostridia bacterium]
MLTEKYAENINTLLFPVECYQPYPPFENREKWESIPQNIKEILVKRGEAVLDYQFEPILASELLNASKPEYGTNFVKKSVRNLSVLMECVVAECVEGKGRFMPQILNGIMIKCEESWWNYPASAYMHRSFPCLLPDMEDPIIDLPSARTANYLALTYFLLIREFDKIDKNIGKRIKYEVKNRVLKPFYEREDIWWMAFTRKINPVMNILHPINNWTPYCVHHCTNAILLLEDDWKKRQSGIVKSMRIMDEYIKYYSEDGCCDEGVSYWYMAPGAMIDYLTDLYDVSGGEINIFENPKIKSMGEFVYKAYIGDYYYINYADAHAVFKGISNKVVKYALKTENETLLRFALKFYNSDSCMKALEGVTDIENTLYIAFNFEAIENHFYLHDIESKDYLLKENYYPDCQVMTARERENDDTGFFLSCKGGHNDESHNHNDVGNFIIFNNRKPVIIDPGVGDYSKKTFSRGRYNIWTMQSDYHNLPVINGFSQSVGHTFKAKHTAFINQPAQVGLSMSLKDTYDEKSYISAYERKVLLHCESRFFISVTDSITMFKETDNLSFTFMTPVDPLMNDEKGELYLDNTILQYNNDLLSVSFEKILLEEESLQKCWGSSLTKIKLSLKKAIKNETFTFTFIKAD